MSLMNYFDYENFLKFKQILDKISENSYESRMFSLFQINLENWFSLEFILLKVLKLQPSELDRMEFYRAEYLMDNLKEWNEKEQKEHKKSQQENSVSTPSMNSLMSDAKKTYSNMMSGIKIPKL